MYLNFLFLLQQFWKCLKWLYPYVQVIGVWWWVFGSRSVFKVTPEVFSWVSADQSSSSTLTHNRLCWACQGSFGVGSMWCSLSDDDSSASPYHTQKNVTRRPLLLIVVNIQIIAIRSNYCDQSIVTGLLRFIWFLWIQGQNWHTLYSLASLFESIRLQKAMTDQSESGIPESCVITTICCYTNLVLTNKQRPTNHA